VVAVRKAMTPSIMKASADTVNIALCGPYFRTINGIQSGVERKCAALTSPAVRPCCACVTIDATEVIRLGISQPNPKPKTNIPAITPKLLGDNAAINVPNPVIAKLNVKAAREE
jgi:hypothetical protein